jgi:hypothetical protein
MVRRDAGTVNDALTRPVPIQARCLSAWVGNSWAPTACSELVAGLDFPDVGESRPGVVSKGHGFSRATRYRREASTLLP